jgi:hypothetical protein
MYGHDDVGLVEVFRKQLGPNVVLFALVVKVPISNCRRFYEECLALGSIRENRSILAA